MLSAPQFILSSASSHLLSSDAEWTQSWKVVKTLVQLSLVWGNRLMIPSILLKSVVLRPGRGPKLSQMKRSKAVGKIEHFKIS